MRVFYGDKPYAMEVPRLMPKMLRQMQAWQKQGTANVSLCGKDGKLVHISQVNVPLSLALAGK